MVIDLCLRYFQWVRLAWPLEACFMEHQQIIQKLDTQKDSLIFSKVNSSTGTNWIASYSKISIDTSTLIYRNDYWSGWWGRVYLQQGCYWHQTVGVADNDWEGCAKIQSNLDRLEKEPNRNLMKFNKEKVQSCT